MEEISAAHLVTLPSFINYCYKTDHADVAYWDQYLQDHPEQRTVIAEAQEMLRMGGWLMQAEKEKAAALAKLDAYLHSAASPKRTRLLPYFAAAASLALLIAAVFFLAKPRSKAPEQVATYHSIDLPRKGIVLPDKSYLLLENGASLTLEPGFGQTERAVRLHGTAYFKVAPDHQKPFSVLAGKYIITALGTAFRVTSTRDTLQVLLEQGRVKVEQQTETGRTLIAMLLPADKLDIHSSRNAATPPATHTRFRQADLAAWKAQEIVFEHTPMADVVQQLEACYNIHIQLKGVDLNKETFSGRFRNDELTNVLDVLCFTLNKRYEITDSTNIIIH